MVRMGDAVSESRKFVVFYLGSEKYGLDVTSVLEVIVPPAMTPLPMVPDFVKGVINLRGRIVTIVDLRLRFGLPPVEGGGNRVIIMEIKNDQKTSYIGFLVDRVTDVLTVEGELDPIPDVIKSAVNNRYLAGIYKEGDEITIILDDEKLLSTRELLSIRQATEELEKEGGSGS